MQSRLRRVFPAAVLLVALAVFVPGTSASAGTSSIGAGLRGPSRLTATVYA